MTKKNGRLSKKDIVNEISKDTLIKPDVVLDVINSLIDIAIEEIVNYGEFQLRNLFTITSYKRSAYDTQIGHVPAGETLSLKVSKKVRFLRKIKLTLLNNESGIIGRDNWKRAVDYYSNLKNNDIEGANPLLEEAD